MSETVDGGRRRLILAAVAVPVLGTALAACSESHPKGMPGSPAELDADVKVRWTALRGESALVALYAATLAAHPPLTGQLAPLAAHHDEHLAALTSDGPLPFGASDEAPAVEAAADPAAALAAVIEAERAASEARVADCLRATGPRLAAVLASIASSEAGHATVLGAR